MERNMIVITGIHGSGKSRLASEVVKELSPQHSIEHLSIGDTIRSIARGAISSYYTHAIQSHLRSARASELLDEEVVYRVMNDALAAHKDTDTLLIDGFPRTQPQVAALGELALLHSRTLSGIIQTSVSDDEAVTRMLKRSPRDYGTPFDAVSAHKRINEDKDLFADMTLERSYPSLPYAVIDTNGSRLQTTQTGIHTVKNMLDIAHNS